MASNGVKTTDIDQTPLLDTILGNYDGSSRVQTFSAFGNQLLGDGPVAARFGQLEDQITSGNVLKSSWSGLLTISPSENGTGGEVYQDDTGTHSDATATGYNGPIVDNAGVYSWSSDWGRWVYIGPAGLASKADLNDLPDAGRIWAVNTFGISNRPVPVSAEIVVTTTPGDGYFAIWRRVDSGAVEDGRIRQQDDKLSWWEQVFVNYQSNQIVQEDLDEAIADEGTARTKADAALSAALDQEAIDRAGADSSLATALAGEETVRTDADAALSAAIAQEATDRVAALATVNAATNLRAPLASPVFTGNPRAPTPGANSSPKSIATIEFVQSVRDTLIGTAPGVLDTFAELAAALGGDPDFATTTANLMGEKFSITDQATYAAQAEAALTQEATDRTDADTAINDALAVETTARTDADSALSAAVGMRAPLISPVFTGNPLAPTPDADGSPQSIATIEFVQSVRDTLIGTAPGVLDTFAELADALGDDPDFATTVMNLIGGKFGKNAQAIFAAQIDTALGSKADTSSLGALAGKNTVGTDDFDTGSVTEPKIAAGAITAAKVFDGTLPAAKLTEAARQAFLSRANHSGQQGPNTILGLVDALNAMATQDWVNSILGNMAAKNFVATDDLNTGSVTEPKIAAASISTVKLVDESVTAAKLSTGTRAILLSRANHTGTQSQNTITDLGADLAARPDRDEMATLLEAQAALLAADIAESLDGAVLVFDPTAQTFKTLSVYDIGGKMPLNWSNISASVGASARVIAVDPVVADRAPREFSIQNLSETDSLWLGFGDVVPVVGSEGSYRVGPGAHWTRENMPAGLVTGVSDGDTINFTAEIGTAKPTTGAGLRKATTAINAHPAPQTIKRAWTQAYARLASSLAAAGILDDALFLALFNVPDTDMAGIDLVSGTSLFTPDNAPTFAPFQGYVLNGTDQRVLTGTPSTSDMVLDHSAFVWTDGTLNDADNYALSSGDIAVAPESSATSAVFKSASTTGVGVTGLSSGGMKWVSRDNAGTYRAGRNDEAAKVTSRAANASLLPFDFIIGCAATSGGANGQPAAESTHFGGTIKSAFVGRAQSDETMAAVWAALAEYDASIGGLV